VVDAVVGRARVTTIAVLGATGAVGGRFVEVVVGQERASIRALIHRWWHTARVVRFPVELRDVAVADGGTATIEVLAGALEGADAAVSFIDGPDADATVAASLVTSCNRAGVGRLVHLGCLTSFGAITSGALDEATSPPCPPGADAARRWAFEEALLEAGAREGIDVIVVTAALVYGPFTEHGAHRPRHHVERGRVAIARGSGACHVVFVDDVVEAVWSAATVSGSLRGRIFVSGPAALRWEDFFRAFEQVVGRPAVAILEDDELEALVRASPEARSDLHWPPQRGPVGRVMSAINRRTIRRGTSSQRRRRLVLPDPDELATRRIDVEIPLGRAEADLGWTPTVDFDEGMRRTAAYLRWADPRERS
jgi:nucleoside-diphosphate-sugar epimerase